MAFIDCYECDGPAGAFYGDEDYECVNNEVSNSDATETTTEKEYCVEMMKGGYFC